MIRCMIRCMILGEISQKRVELLPVSSCSAKCRPVEAFLNCDILDNEGGEYLCWFSTLYRKAFSSLDSKRSTSDDLIRFARCPVSVPVHYYSLLADAPVRFHHKVWRTIQPNKSVSLEIK